MIRRCSAKYHHSDALFPDAGRRGPFGTGTSVSWWNLDYRFRNDTEQPVQIVIWQDDETLYGELRSLHPYDHTWSLKKKMQDLFRKMVFSTGFQKYINSSMGKMEISLIADSY